MKILPAVDVANVEMFSWLNRNCSEKEIDMIYISHNFSKAYLLQRDKDNYKELTEVETKILEKVKAIIKTYDMPDLNKREMFQEYHIHEE